MVPPSPAQGLVLLLAATEDVPSGAVAARVQIKVVRQEIAERPTAPAAAVPAVMAAKAEQVRVALLWWSGYFKRADCESARHAIFDIVDRKS
jgi:hypothetical protein